MRKRSGEVMRRFPGAVVALAIAGAGTWVGAMPSTARAATAHEDSVVVRAVPGAHGRVEQEIVELGGHVDRELAIINGMAAHVPAPAVAVLRADTDVVSVTADSTVHPMTYEPALGYDTANTGSLSEITRIVGAQRQWAAGYTGAGIGVALIDTGVTRVTGLAGAGQVIDGPDLSFDSQSPALAHRDSFGHGTNMAGIIAGRDPGATSSTFWCSACLNSSGYSDQSKFVGVAPGAHIVSVKAGATDGAADVSQVIAAIDWVVQHKDDPGLNIKVLNLSFGTNATQAYTIDPLAYAAEVAWNRGIVVVAAGGNDGRAVPTLADPAYDPHLIAVGADDPMGTASALDDTVPAFATHGTSSRPVDVIAPGVHVLSLRVPGSFVDTYYPGGVVGTRFQLGSGTSQATAVVSGVVALLRQRFPYATPDQIKALLKLGAARINANVLFSGSGIVNATVSSTLGSATGVIGGLHLATAGAAGTGTGTLEASRGDSHVTDGTTELTGEKDVFGHTFNSGAMATAEASHTSWTGGTWNGNLWTGSGSAASGWSVITWAGTNWAGHAWSGSRWKNMSWDGSRWTGAGWAGSRWRDASWSDAIWSGSRWR